MKFLLVPNLVLKGVLSLITCQCFFWVFFGASFYISTCVSNKHMDILAFYLNDCTFKKYICHTFQNFQSRVQDENSLCCGPLSNVTQK